MKAPKLKALPPRRPKFSDGYGDIISRRKYSMRALNASSVLLTDRFLVNSM